MKTESIHVALIKSMTTHEPSSGQLLNFPTISGYLEMSRPPVKVRVAYVSDKTNYSWTAATLITA